MEREEIITTVKDVISRETEVPADSIELGTRLADLGIDSLDVLKFALAFENLFKITISTADVLQIQTVGDIVARLEGKVASAG